MIKFFALVSALVFLYAGCLVSKVLSVLDLKKIVNFSKRQQGRSRNSYDATGYFCCFFRDLGFPHAFIRTETLRS